jgi:hypothetical protein
MNPAHALTHHVNLLKLIVGTETPETARDARNSAKNFAGIEANQLRLEN